MVEIVIRYDPATGAVSLGAAAPVPGALLNLVLDLAKGAVLRETVAALRAGAVAVPTADQVRELTRG